MQLYSIASGSSGNCIYLGEEDGGIFDRCRNQPQKES